MRAWKSGVWSLGGQAINVVITIGTLAVLGRLLSPAEFGLFGLVLAIHAMARPVLDMGLMPVYLKLEKIDNNASNVFFTINLLMGCAITSLMFLFSPWVARYYETDALQPLLMVSSLSLLLGALGGQPQALLMRSKRFDTIVKVQTAVLLAGSGLVIWLAWLGYGVWALVWRMVFEAGARFMALAWASKNEFRLVGFQKILPWMHELKFGMEIAGSRLVMGWVGSLDKLILGKLGTLGELGGYTRSQQFALMPANNIGNAICTPALSYLARRAESSKVDDYLLLTWILALFSGIPCVVIIIHGDILLSIVLGGQWVGFGWMLQWLGLFGLARMFVVLLTSYQVDMRRASSTSRYVLLSSFIVLPIPIMLLVMNAGVGYFIAGYAILSFVYWYFAYINALCRDWPNDAARVRKNLALVFLLFILSAAGDVLLQSVLGAWGTRYSIIIGVLSTFGFGLMFICLFDYRAVRRLMCSYTGYR